MLAEKERLQKDLAPKVGSASEGVALREALGAVVGRVRAVGDDAELAPRDRRHCRAPSRGHADGRAPGRGGSIPTPVESGREEQDSDAAEHQVYPSEDERELLPRNAPDGFLEHRAIERRDLRHIRN